MTTLRFHLGMCCIHAAIWLLPGDHAPSRRLMWALHTWARGEQNDE